MEVNPKVNVKLRTKLTNRKSYSVDLNYKDKVNEAIITLKVLQRINK